MKKIFLNINLALLSLIIFSSSVGAKNLLPDDKKLLLKKIIAQIEKDKDKQVDNDTDEKADTKSIRKCNFDEGVNDVINIYEYSYAELYAAVQKKFQELGDFYNKTNEAYNRYNSATSKPYKFVNYNFKEQISEDLQYMEKYKAYLKSIMKKYDEIDKNNRVLYVLETKEPICKEYTEAKKGILTYTYYNPPVSNEKNSINIVDQRYHILFSYKLLDYDVFANRSISTKPVQFIDRDGSLKSVDFQVLFNGYMEDLYRIGNDQDIVNQQLIRELGDMQNSKKVYMP